MQRDTKHSRHTERKRSIPFHFTNNAILRGLSNCSPQNDGKNCVAALNNSRKVAFTEPSRGMSGAKVEQTSAETLSFRCVCERCRLTRGDVSKSTCKVAFTLAEVLITLGIIGVVAALTLPTLIKNYQKTVWVNQYKKAYNVLNNGFKQIVANEGTTSIEALYLDNRIGLNFADERIRNKFVKTFKLSNVQTVEKAESIYDYETFCLNGLNENACGLGNFNESLPNDFRSFIGTTPDGMFFFISNLVNTNTIGIDTNGLKGPNILGRDIFAFYYFDNNGSVVVEPVGTMLTMDFEAKVYGEPIPSHEELIKMINENCSSTAEDLDGITCGAKIIMDGWKMNY